MLEKKVYNNDDITFFSVLTFIKPLCDNVLEPLPLRGSGCNTLCHLGFANVNTWKRMFYPLIKHNSKKNNLTLLHSKLNLLNSERLKLQRVHTTLNVKGLNHVFLDEHNFCSCLKKGIQKESLLYRVV